MFLFLHLHDFEDDGYPAEAPASYCNSQASKAELGPDHLDQPLNPELFSKGMPPGVHPR